MRYIITEQQEDRLKENIIKFLDKLFVPKDGWKKPSEYRKHLDHPLSDSELFIFLGSTQDDTDQQHFFYSRCDNPNYEYHDEDESCPEIRIPTTKYEILQDSFGNMWVPIFVEWFTKHTSLPVNFVSTID